MKHDGKKFISIGPSLSKFVLPITPLPAEWAPVPETKVKPHIDLAASFGIPASIVSSGNDGSSYATSNCSSENFKQQAQIWGQKLRESIDRSFALYCEAEAINLRLPDDLKSTPEVPNRLAYLLAQAAREFESLLSWTDAYLDGAARSSRLSRLRYAVCWRYVDPETGELCSAIHNPKTGLPFWEAYEIQRGLLKRMDKSPEMCGRAWLAEIVRRKTISA